MRKPSDPLLLVLLAAPMVLSVPILAWQAARLLGRQPSKLELAGAYLLSVLAMISIFTFTGMLLTESREYPPDLVVTVGSSAAMFVLNFFLLWRNLRKRVSGEAVAEAFLLGGYLPNALFCLVAFGWEWKHLGVGAYLIAVVCVGYAVAIVLLSRRRLDDVPSIAGQQRTHDVA
jgi:hypothetical protein